MNKQSIPKTSNVIDLQLFNIQSIVANPVPSADLVDRQVDRRHPGHRPEAAHHLGQLVQVEQVAPA